MNDQLNFVRKENVYFPILHCFYHRVPSVLPLLKYIYIHYIITYMHVILL